MLLSLLLWALGQVLQWLLDNPWSESYIGSISKRDKSNMAKALDLMAEVQSVALSKGLILQIDRRASGKLL